jgi:PilX N-terminal
MQKAEQSERGFALIMVLFVLMLLSAIGLALMYMSNTETSINSNFRAGQQAYYASKAGLEEGRERLRFSVNNALTPPSVMPSTTTTAGVIYITNPTAGEAVTPWNTTNPQYFDDELCHENFAGLGLGQSNTPDVPCTAAPGGTYYTQVASDDPKSGTTAAMPYKWVRITLKQVGSTYPYCVDGSTSCNTNGTMVCATTPSTSTYPYEVPLPAGFANCDAANMKPVYTLTALAVTSTGSRRMTQYEIAAVYVPPLPGSIVFDGSNPVFNGGSSNAFNVNGNDNCGQTTAKPALGAYDTNAANTLTTDASGRPSGYQGAGGTPSVQNVGSQLGALTTVGGLETLVANLTAVADQVYPANPSSVNLGTSTTPLITVVQGDFNAGNASGAGILLVEGTLTLQGNPNWDGVILVIGKGDIEKSGGGNGTVNGGILIANLYDSQGNLLPPSSPPGVPTINWSGGGTANINYDSCWIKNVQNRPVFRVMASHEEMY